MAFLRRWQRALPPVVSTDPVELVPFDGPLRHIPESRAGVYQTFGNPGTLSPSRKFKRQNLVTARELPNIPRGKLYCHRLAEPYLREALRRTMPGLITRIGCYSYRRQRHDPARPLSYHSWGIAVDINPRDNRARYFSQRKPAPWTDEWFEVWPGEGAVTKSLVEAFESCGWRWGGRWQRFVDPMHFQLCGK